MRQCRYFGFACANEMLWRQTNWNEAEDKSWSERKGAINIFTGRKRAGIGGSQHVGSQLWTESVHTLGRS